MAQPTWTSTHFASCASAAFTVARRPPSGSVVTVSGIVRTVPFVEVIVAVAENSAAERFAAASRHTNAVPHSLVIAISFSFVTRARR